MDCTGLLIKWLRDSLKSPQPLKDVILNVPLFQMPSEVSSPILRAIPSILTGTPYSIAARRTLSPLK
jgi:hypothetical protein